MRYTKAMREWAVYEVQYNGRTMAEVGREIGADWATIRRWCKPEYEQKNRDKATIYNNRKCKGEFTIGPDTACCICNMTNADCITKHKMRLALDHDHKTDLDRGYLCHNCNRMLGYAGDSIDRLQSAIAYLRQHST